MRPLKTLSSLYLVTLASLLLATTITLQKTWIASLGKNMDIHSSGAQASTSTVADSSYDDAISYYSPNVNGFAVGYSLQPENAGASSYIVTYSGNGIHAHFAGNDADATQMGVSFSMSGATIAVGAGDDGTASNSKSTDIGVKYALNDTTTLGMMSASKAGRCKIPKHWCKSYSWWRCLHNG